MPTDLKPPSRLLYYAEAPRSVVEYSLGLVWMPALLAASAPARDRHPVLVLPDLLADDRSTQFLRTFLTRLGYPVHGWDLGPNVGPTSAVVDGLERLLRRLSGEGQRVSIVGWSLGGLFARQLARRNPDIVRQVVTLGSPFGLTAKSQSRASRLLDRFSHIHVHPGRMPLYDDADARPHSMRFTSIYTRADGVVAWKTCLDRRTTWTQNIEVYGSHSGLGYNPAVLYAVANRLAQSPADWVPFRAPLAFRALFPRPAT